MCVSGGCMEHRVKREREQRKKVREKSASATATIQTAVVSIILSYMIKSNIRLGLCRVYAICSSKHTLVLLFDSS